MLVAEQTDWLDGPRLYEWLKEHGLDHPAIELGREHERAIRHWRDGRRANVYTVDRVLVALGLHLSEVPDDCWVDPPYRGELKPERRAEILRLIKDEGMAPGTVARLTCVDPRTVRRCLAREAA